MTGREPDDGGGGKRSRGVVQGVLGYSGPSHVRCLPVRAVPLAAVIPSRVPGRGRGAWGGPRQRRSGGVNQGGARATRTGGADRTATSRLAAGQEGCHATGPGDPAGACGRQRMWPSRRP